MWLASVGGGVGYLLAPAEISCEPPGAPLCIQVKFRKKQNGPLWAS